MGSQLINELTSLLAVIHSPPWGGEKKEKNWNIRKRKGEKDGKKNELTVEQLFLVRLLHAPLI